MNWFYMYFQTSLFCKGAFTNWPLTWLFILMNWLIMFIQITFLRTAVITKHVASLSHELIFFCRCLQLCTLVDVLAKNTTEPPISKDCDSTSKRKCQLGIQYRGWGWPWEWQAGRVHSCSLCCTRLTSLKRRQAQVSICLQISKFLFRGPNWKENREDVHEIMGYGLMVVFILQSCK